MKKVLFTFVFLVALPCVECFGFPQLEREERRNIQGVAISFLSAYSPRIRYYIPKRLEGKLRLSVYQSLGQSASQEKDGFVSGRLFSSAPQTVQEGTIWKIAPLQRVYSEVSLLDGKRHRFVGSRASPVFVSFKVRSSMVDALRVRPQVSFRQWLLFRGVYALPSIKRFSVSYTKLIQAFRSFAVEGVLPFAKASEFVKKLEEDALQGPSVLPLSVEERHAVFTLLRERFFRYELRSSPSGSFLGVVLDTSKKEKSASFVLNASTLVERLHVRDFSLPVTLPQNLPRTRLHSWGQRLGYIRQGFLFFLPAFLSQHSSFPQIFVEVRYRGRIFALKTSRQNSKTTRRRSMGFFLGSAKKKRYGYVFLSFHPQERLFYRFYWHRGKQEYVCGWFSEDLVLYEQNITLPSACFARDPVFAKMLKSSR